MFVLDKNLSVRVVSSANPGSPQEADVKALERLIDNKLQDLCNELSIMCPWLTLRIANNSFNTRTTDDVKMLESYNLWREQQKQIKQG